MPARHPPLVPDDRAAEDTLWALFERQVARTPDAAAVEHRTLQMSYRELDERVAQVARHLGELAPDTPVALLLDRGPWRVVASLAVLKAGGAYLPLDPACPDARLRGILQEAQPAVLVTQGGSAGRDLGGPRRLCVDDLPAGEPIRSGRTPPRGDHLAYVIYTSGSTGTPKGVTIEHAGACALAADLARRLDLAPGTRVLQFSSWTFDASVFEWTAALTTGGTLVLADADELPPLCDLADTLARREIHVALLPPSVLRSMGRRPLPALRTLLSGGEACTPDIVRDWAPGRRLFNVYGPTEVTVLCTLAELSPGASPHLGGAVAGHEVFVLDADLLPVEPGQVGELCVAGRGLARGYLGAAALTASRFVRPSPGHPLAGRRLYRTGDLARRHADGRLEYIGRADRQVKFNGFRIELGEIEWHLGQHPGVRQAAVVHRPRESGGEWLVAWVAVHRDDTDEASLREWLRGRLPAHMVPQRCVRIDALPLTSHGKVDREALQQRRPCGQDVRGDTPHTDAERRLEQVWRAVLGVDEVGLDDNFYALGGDSILAIRMVHGAQAQGLALSGAMLARHPTLRALAANARPSAPPQDESPLPIGQPFGLTPIQHWFFEQEFAQPHRFSQCQWIAMPPPDVERLQRTLDRLLAGYDAFRLRFPRIGGVRCQVYAERAPSAVLRRADLAHCDDPGQAMDALARAWLQDFDFEAGRTVSIGLASGHPDGRARLFIGLHHLVCDGLSWRVLLDDLRRRDAGEPPAAPGTPLVRWQAALQAHAETARTLAQLPHWVRAKAVSPAYRRALACERGATLRFDVERPLTQVLPDSAREHRMEVLLAAFVQCLSRHTGSLDVSVQLEGHGREPSVGVDPGRSVGWYTTLYPARFSLPEGNSPAAVFDAVRQQYREIPERGLGYGLLRYLHPDAAVRARLAEADCPVIFNYLGSFHNAEHGHWQVHDRHAGQDAVPDDEAGPAVLEVNCAVVDDRLVCRVGHAHSLMDEASARRFAEDFLTESRTIALARDRSVDAAYPLTPLQEGMLFHQRLAPDGDTYHVQAVWRYASVPDRGRLQRAWVRLVAELPALRTYFRWEPPARPLQCVAHAASFAFAWTDLSSLPDRAQDDEIRRLLDEDRARPFDPGQPGLLRVHAVQRSASACELLWSYHHLILDGWSSSLVLERLHALYDDEHSPAPPRARFDEYVEHLARQDTASARAHMAAWLAGGGWSTEIGVRRPGVALDPLKPVLRQATVELALPAADTAQVAALQRQHGITPGTLALFAFGCALSACDQGRDVLFGTTLSGRHHEDALLRGLVGVTINTLPVLLRFEASQPAHEALAALQRQVAQLHEHAFVPLRSLDDPLTGRPLQFNALVVFENYPGQERVGGGSLQAELVREVEKPGYPLTAVCRFRGGLLDLRLLYDADVFAASAMQGFVRLWRHLMRQVATHPSRRCAEFTLVEQAEPALLRGPPSQHRLQRIDHAFEAQVASQPDRLALVCGERQLSYSQLDALANVVRDLVLEARVARGSLVALVADRAPELVAGELGILKAGCAYVPLDLGSPVERLRAILDDAGVDHVFALHPLAEEVVGTPVAQWRCGALRLLQRVARPAARSVVPRLAPGDALAHVMYTSGSTGRPKGVMVTHRGVLRLVTKPNHFEFVPGQRMLQTSSAGFDASTLEVWGMLLNGGTLVQVPADVLLDPEAGAAALRRYRIDLMFLTTPLFHRWASDDPQAFAPLRQLMVGGDVLPAGSAAAVRRLHPGLRLLNVYGPTENTTLSTFHVISSAPQEAVPIGRPVNGTSCEVLDAWGRALPAGVVGELWVGGEGLACGYLNDADATARCFVGEGEARRYRTGDLVRLREDGEFDFVGRIDQQVKIGGQRVEPEEVEWHLQRHPALREAAVVVCDDDSGDKRLVAFCVLHEGAPPDPAAWLDAHLRGCLPAALRPQRYETVQALPLNPSGKVDRGSLRRRPLAVLPAQPDIEVPATPSQQQVLAAWQDSLGVPAIGLDEGFHSLGGDSLKAIRVCTLLRRQGWRLRVSDLMRHPTIRHCAERLERIGGDAAPPAAQGDSAPLSPVQRRFLGRGLANPHHFVIPLLLRMKRPFAADALRDAVQHALEGQDGPFVRFVRDASTGSWHQQRMPWQPEDWFERIDVDGDDPEGQVVQHAECTCRSFDLHAGPLFRVTCFERDGHAALVHLVFHHLVCDGISLGVLLERMRGFLAAPGPAQPPAISYLQWCRLLHRHAGEAARSQRAHWMQVLAGGEEGRLQRPPHREMATQVHDTLRDAAEIEACTRLAARRGDSLFALLLAAMAVALRRTGLAPPALHIQTAQREPVLAGEAIDLHDTVGYCSAAVPVRVPQARGVAEMLEALSRPLRELPETAPGYLALRHLQDGLDDPCTVMFHYLAEDPLQRSDDLFEPADLPAGPSTDRGNESAYLLNLTVARRAARLATTCYFSPAHYRPSDIERLAGTFREVLQAACAESEEPRR